MLKIGFEHNLDKQWTAVMIITCTQTGGTVIIEMVTIALVVLLVVLVVVVLVLVVLVLVVLVVVVVIKMDMIPRITDQ